MARPSEVISASERMLMAGRDLAPDACADALALALGRIAEASLVDLERVVALVCMRLDPKKALH